MAASSGGYRSSVQAIGVDARGRGARQRVGGAAAERVETADPLVRRVELGQRIEQPSWRLARPKRVRRGLCATASGVSDNATVSMSVDMTAPVRSARSLKRKGRARRMTCGARPPRTFYYTQPRSRTSASSTATRVDRNDDTS